ncbi:lycopene beta-cyclase CrtY [Antarcticirhabdus aurantiaca]|uniref:Lycopene beta-cyclase CrtY n=1 Tax=Antarcticirhabdus aurantiaca TaxID=2606717 RepID=A0ACD4NRA9_9HYPH|nr:lycopene beta-cyclase CrtY [Antarcticirhabdus aurantiaca]WAJ29268.1 lycopene beta-cyclase CrtY [Jeongeuplla avenae]
MSARSRPVDLLLVGGGLANGLIAWRLAETRPDVSVLVLEAGPEIGGNHTWSFHDGDLTGDQHRWTAPFVAHRWAQNEVRFPERRKTLPTGYRSATSALLAEALRARLGTRIRTRARVAEIAPTRVVLDGGETIEAGAVVDGRGPRPSPHMRLGFQKFLGIEIETRRPHGLSGPIIMDATVPQTDGYRFVYSLPFAPDRLLVEDTYYADGEVLDTARLAREIETYAEAQGWAVARIVREEEGILPIALGGSIEAFWDEKRGVPASGLSAALFHPTTGYSLPDAVRLADHLATLPDLSAPALFAAVRRHSIAIWRERRFFRMLNRMLFLAGPPEERYRVLQHFYRLDPGLVARFYAARLTAADKLRILTGRPPVPVGAALRVLAFPPPPKGFAVP